MGLFSSSISSLWLSLAAGTTEPRRHRQPPLAPPGRAEDATQGAARPRTAPKLCIPAHRRVLDLHDLYAPFQPEPLCGSVIGRKGHLPPSTIRIADLGFSNKNPPQSLLCRRSKASSSPKGMLQPPSLSPGRAGSRMETRSGQQRNALPLRQAAAPTARPL